MDEEEVVFSEGDSTCRHCNHDKHSDGACECGCKNYAPVKWRVVSAGPAVTFEDELFTCGDCGKSFTVSGFTFTSYDEHRSLILALHHQEDCRAWRNVWKYWQYRVMDWWKDRRRTDEWGDDEQPESTTGSEEDEGRTAGGTGGG